MAHSELGLCPQCGFDVLVVVRMDGKVRDFFELLTSKVLSFATLGYSRSTDLLPSILEKQFLRGAHPADQGLPHVHFGHVQHLCRQGPRQQPPKEEATPTTNIGPLTNATSVMNSSVGGLPVAPSPFLTQVPGESTKVPLG